MEMVKKIARTLQDLEEQGCGGKSFLYGEIAAGRLKAIKLGKRTVVLDPERDAWLASRPPAISRYRQKKKPGARSAA